MLTLLVATRSGAESAGDALSNVDKATLDAPVCDQMKAYKSQLSDASLEIQAAARGGGRRRTCDMIGRATSLMAEVQSYMRLHIGQCSINQDGIAVLGSAAGDLAGSRAKYCR